MPRERREMREMQLNADPPHGNPGGLMVRLAWDDELAPDLPDIVDEESGLVTFESLTGDAVNVLWIYDEQGPWLRVDESMLWRLPFCPTGADQTIAARAIYKHLRWLDERNGVTHG